MIFLLARNLEKLVPCPFELAHLGIWDPLNSEEKVSLIINNSVADCSILLKFRTEFVHATAEVPHKFKVKGSKIKVTA